MSALWIVQRDAQERAALARLAAAEDAVRGAPGDVHFDAAPAPRVVLLGLGGLGGLGGDWEAELEFAHRHRARLADAHWILLGERDDRDAALELFDRVVAEFVPYPPPAAELRERIRAATREMPPPLSQRARREAVAARFSRWLADLEIPELLRALDPRLAEVPLRVCGEPGTGRSVLVRYVHHLGVTADGALAHIPCTEQTNAREIRQALSSLSRSQPELSSLCIWLDEVGRLPRGTQQELREWIEAGPPPGVRAPHVRWVATLDETGPPLERGLAQTLGRLEIRLPPLRERIQRLQVVVGETARAWAAARRETVRRFGEDALAAMEEYPWPGNLRELEAVVEQTLANTRGAPIRADDLLLEGSALAPLDASAFGTLLPDDQPLPEPRPGADEEAPDWAASLDEPDWAAGLDEPDWTPIPERSDPAPRPSPSEPPPGALAQTHPERAGAPLCDEAGLRQLAGALSRELRPPLSTIRSFAELLPKSFDDPEFRARFTKLVSEGVQHVDELLERLERLSALDAPDLQKVDVPALLETLLEERRDAFHSRHLLVLKELDSSRPFARADAQQLRIAFAALLDTALDLVPERGDVYLASRYHDGGGGGEASVRVLLRFHDPSARLSRDGSLAAEMSLSMIVAELGIRAQGGQLTLAASDSEERVIVIDLPAP